ncbi:hypothetical protein AX14_003648 [Amanita brunnescens Koide BX004]|nr:hypothetical protein AX14_003648 [Amanita brunnescens Koide BX004]
MALNWTMLKPDRSPMPLPNEMNIITVNSGVDITLIIPHGPSSSTSSSGVPAADAKRLKAIGRFWLTDQRLIFTSSTPNNTFDSLSVPLPSILCTRFEQPTFGSNYLTFEVKPSPGGELTEGTTVMVRFKDRAMFEFVSLLEKTRERAIYMKRQAREEEEEGLPSYTGPAESSHSVTMIGSIPVDNPPGYDV